MKRTIYICDHCKTHTEPFISRPVGTPGQWTLWGPGTDNHSIHACERKCAEAIDAKELAGLSAAEENAAA